jgi:hypothetical protein
LVAADLVGRAAASSALAAQITAGAGVHGGNELKNWHNAMNRVEL